jgi:hypothetical protein
MRARSALIYSVLRLLAFFVPFGIMMLFPIMREQYLLSAVFAALIGLSLSMLFLRRPLEEATAGLAERRAARRAGVSDEATEDAVIDEAPSEGTAAADPAHAAADEATDRPEQPR